MSNDEVARAIQFLTEWLAHFSSEMEEQRESTKALKKSSLRTEKLTKELVADRHRVIQLIELQSSRLDRMDLWWKDHEDRIRRLESE